MLLAGVVLLASGMVLRLRSTTITGAAMLLVYLATLLLYINRLPNVQLAAIWMTIGGGVIVAAGVLLSVYRDRLLTLPDQVKRREGIFRVLTCARIRGRELPPPLFVWKIAPKFTFWISLATTRGSARHANAWLQVTTLRNYG